MENNRCAFFLGANSARGFVSFFGDAAREDFGRDTYFIKGGPGCGKATAIKKLASAADPTGEREEILCSSDPGSLDGIILRNGRAAFIDGTAPHTCDPSFPGMRGDYIALSAYKDIPALKEKYPAAVLLDAQSKDCYTRAYRLISSASLIDEHIRGIMTPHMPKERLIRRAKGIAAREISQKGGVGKARKRFIDGVTPDGYMRLYETACALAGRIYDIYDSFGFSGIMLEVLIDAAVRNGHDIYACYDAVDTERLLHLIIPGLSLAFVTSDRRRYFTGRPYRQLSLIPLPAPAEGHGKAAGPHVRQPSRPRLRRDSRRPRPARQDRGPLPSPCRFRRTRCPCPHRGCRHRRGIWHGKACLRATEALTEKTSGV